MCIMYESVLCSLTCRRSRSTRTVHNSAGFGHATRGCREDHEMGAKNLEDAARADRQSIHTSHPKVSVSNWCPSEIK